MCFVESVIDSINYYSKTVIIIARVYYDFIDEIKFYFKNNCEKIISNLPQLLKYLFKCEYNSSPELLLSIKSCINSALRELNLVERSIKN